MDVDKPWSPDLILCAVNTSSAGELAIVDWDQGALKNEEGYSCLPGLRVVNTRKMAKPYPSVDFKAHIHFFKISEE
jgi:hypothetical protein